MERNGRRKGNAVVLTEYNITNLDGEFIMKYTVGEKVCISVDTMINKDADMDYVDIMTDYDGEETFYMLLNEFGELCCLDGEECTIDHIVNGTTDIYDLVNHNDGDVHFMLSEHDLDIAVFR